MKKEVIARLIVLTISWVAIVALGIGLLIWGITPIGSIFFSSFQDGCLTAPFLELVEAVAKKTTEIMILFAKVATPIVFKVVVSLVGVAFFVVECWAVKKVFFTNVKKTKKAVKQQEGVVDENPYVGEIDH